MFERKDAPTHGLRIDFDYDGRVDLQIRYKKFTAVWTQPCPDGWDYAGKDYEGREVWLRSGTPIVCFDPGSLELEHPEGIGFAPTVRSANRPPDTLPEEVR